MRLNWMISAVVLSCLLCVAAESASSQPSGSLLTSWEGSMDGWHIYLNDDPAAHNAPEANGICYSTTGVTDGKQSLAVAIKDGFR
ncbi:MAG TPA: hypothetical protein VKK61_08540, partial [Tepidisphaeraceae bacterium]|nr:hypothetical protein [Tepidisphaeraceae bacterium]